MDINPVALSSNLINSFSNELLKIGEDAKAKKRRFPLALRNALLGAAGVGMGAGLGELTINAFPKFFNQSTPSRAKLVQFGAPMLAGALMLAQSKRRKAEEESAK